MTQLAKPTPSMAAPFASANRLVRTEAWAEGIAVFAATEADGHAPDAEARVLQLIARMRLGDEAAQVSLDACMVRAANARADLRRHVVGPLVKKGRLELPVVVLGVLVEAYPDLADDYRLLVSLLGRTKQWDAALRRSEDWARCRPADVEAQACRIKALLQCGRIQDAAAIAGDTMMRVHQAPLFAHVWLVALVRAGEHVRASALVREIGVEGVLDERAAGMALHALLADDRGEEAVALGSAVQGRGVDGPHLRLERARACLAVGPIDEKIEQALQHLQTGLAVAHDDVPLNALYGETLLRAGRSGEAIFPLAKSCELAPHLEQSRAMYARALQYSGKASEAADQWLTLLKGASDASRWQRPAVASLTRAGRMHEAESLFRTFMEQRSAMLPAAFSEGLNRLWDKTGAAHIPVARFDWAWSLRDDTQTTDRVAWESAGRWGHLADHLLLDWLECRGDRADEAMAFLADLDETERFLMPLMNGGSGLIVATAHVGPLYAGPMALDLLGVPSRWLASTPSMARSSYAAGLISTSDQTEAQVAKACLKALQTGQAVCLAVDGAATMAAPRVRFEGQEITYSSFAARAAHRSGAPSIFCAPRWEQQRITFELALLPVPAQGEEVAEYAARWQDAYLRHLRNYLRGAPENLRLSGGIWRHVRSPHRGRT